MNQVKNYFSPAVRGYLYTVAGAVLAMLGVYGVLDGNKMAAINLVLSAVFGVARAHVPSTSEADVKPADPTA